MRERSIVVTEDFVAEASDLIAAKIRAAQAERGRVSVALCGGSTPAPVYRRLTELGLDWNRVELFFGDERCVPADHSDSNYRLVSESMLEHLEGEPPRIVRMEGELADRDAAARRYEDELPEAIDLLIQGMGEDGHTASLFPGSPALDDASRRVVAVVGPKPPPERLSLAPAALRAARDAVVLAKGEGKAEVVRQVLEEDGDFHEYPVRLVADATWILDAGAASALSEARDG